MKSYKILKQVIDILLLAYFASCSASYEVTTRDELFKPEDLGPISVQTTDGKQYVFEKYKLEGNLLICKGKLFTGKKNEIGTYNLKLSEIKKIQATHSITGKVILITGVSAAMLAIIFAVMKNSENGLTKEIQYGCNISDKSKEHHNNSLANRITNMFKISSGDSINMKFVDVMYGSETAHFRIINDSAHLELQIVDQISYCDAATNINYQ